MKIPGNRGYELLIFIYMNLINNNRETSFHNTNVELPSLKKQRGNGGRTLNSGRHDKAFYAEQSGG